MVTEGYVPNRGNIVWMSFNPQAGHEQAGRRPALIVSPQEYNAITSLALCCPITSQVKGYPFEVGLPPDGRITGVVLADQIRNLDWKARRAQFECETTDGVVQEVIGKVSALLG